MSEEKEGTKAKRKEARWLTRFRRFLAKLARYEEGLFILGRPPYNIARSGHSLLARPSTYSEGGKKAASWPVDPFGPSPFLSRVVVAAVVVAGGVGEGGNARKRPLPLKEGEGKREGGEGGWDPPYSFFLDVAIEAAQYFPRRKPEKAVE